MAPSQSNPIPLIDAHAPVGADPGLMRTPLTRWIDQRPAEARPYERKILLGRLGRPEKMGGAGGFLSNEAAGSSTGQTIAIDGGLTVNQTGRFNA